MTSIIIKDIDLISIEDIEARLQSICKQKDKLDNIFQTRDLHKHHLKYCKLVARQDKLETRLHKIKREMVE